MFSKTRYRYTVSFLGWVLIFSLWIGLPGAIANDDPCNLYGCDDDCEFTQEFRLQDCWWFSTIGKNPYFILKPGYRLVLISDDGLEKSVETVLRDIKWIHLGGRWIRTRVLEERAFERDHVTEEWKTIEISLNYFAICRRTNAVYYFGEWSRDCPDGFDENDDCPDGESNEGSWEAGEDGALPGLIMPGTPLRGAKYFQEIAEEQEAVDRGEIADLGLHVEVPAGEWWDCIEIYDTNPTEANPGNSDEDGCIGENDVKLYCPGVGLVQDQDLELVCYGFECDGDDGDDDDGDDDDDDDDDNDPVSKSWILPQRFKLWNF